MDWVVLSLLSAIFVALNDILTKSELKVEMPLHLAFSVSLSVSLLSLTLFPPPIPSLEIFALLMLKSVLMASSWILYLRAFRELSIHLIEPLSNTSPVILLLFSYLFLGERLGLPQLAGVGLVVGASLLLKDELHLKKPSDLPDSGPLVPLFAAMTMGCLLAVLDKAITAAVGYPSMIFYPFLFMAVGYGVVIAWREGVKELWLGFEGEPLLFLLGVFSFVRDLFYFQAVVAPSSLISLIIPLKKTGSVLASFVGGKYFGEDGFLKGTAVAAATVVGIALISSG